LLRSGTWVTGLAALQKPLLHLHTRFERDLPWARIDIDFMNLPQPAPGDREFGFLEPRTRDSLEGLAAKYDRRSTTLHESTPRQRLT
jgi:L-arabinose isomerase